jgi:hypothetical protein
MPITVKLVKSDTLPLCSPEELSDSNIAHHLNVPGALTSTDTIEKMMSISFEETHN